MSCSKITTSIFCYGTAIVNPIIVAKFFHKICKNIFNHLLRVKLNKGELFGPVPTYVKTVEIWLVNAISLLFKVTEWNI